MSSAVDLKTKEEKDAELDKRIEALRKKNEALVKRYQEIEEDKKKAEQEGIAVTTPRKPRTHEPEADRRKTEKENLTVTVDLSKPAGQDKRVVNDWKPSTPRGRKKSEESDSPKGQSDGRSPPRRTGSGRVGRGGQRGGGGGGRQERRDWETRTPREGESAEPGGQGRRGGRRGGRGGRGAGGGGGVREGGAGSGSGEEGTPGGMDRKSKEWEEKRRQNIEKMNEEMERIAEYERGQRVDGDKPIRNFLDDPRRSGPAPDIDRKEGSRRHVRNWGGLDFDNVKTGNELEREWTSRRPGPKGGSVDMTMSMTGRERAEYLRWKKEREQIDEERLARHRNATGQWRREWDAQKTDGMFKEDPNVAAEGVTAEEGGRRDDSKRPPRGPTFGDFLSQGRSQGPRGDRSRGRGRGQRQSYSMHDNRWEGEKEEEEKEKEDKTKKEVKTTSTKTKKEEEEKPKAETEEPKVEEKKEDEAGDDDDEWEDASEEEEAGDRSDSEKKDKSKAVSPPSAKQRLQEKMAGSPKEQRAPRPKVRIPPPPAAAAQESSDGGKPLSPFFTLEGHHPVSDWGEEMEMQSPRSSMGAESPLKPSSTESSPPQKKESQDGDAGEPGPPTDESAPAADTQKNITESEPQQTASEPPSEGSDLAPSSAAPEVNEVAVTTNQNPLPAPSEEGQSDPPRPAESINGEQISSDAPVENEDNMAPDGSDDAPAAEAEAELSSDQTSSG
ncbi:coiled-coil domain-containing protein 9 isoform X1 [Xiphophorus couchianus]|uniref:coiled-coil domain-containing protein 9 isoform X1 n=1 Tax=Xiphophorus couchianus TaxID=32473 RepID=UPI001016164C|nr:coiled-coil domain-containing protein 9 isoform X1 [Xiphophorus couchianus]